MVTYDQIIRDRRPLARRPASYEELLLLPLANSPLTREARSYPDWEYDHGASRAFRVGGMRRFMRSTGIHTVKEISRYIGDAIATIKRETDWQAMPLSSGKWESCSTAQITAAVRGDALFFQKAAIIVVACELAAEARFDAGDLRGPQSADSSNSVYGYMSLVGSAWHVEGFDRDRLVELRQRFPGLNDRLIESAGQTSRAFVDQMALGYAVTFSTALAIENALSNDFGIPDIGPISVRPRKNHGKMAANDFEIVDLGSSRPG